MDIREAGDEMLIEELANRGILRIKTFSDTELNNELTTRRNEAMKRYEAMMEQGLV